MGQAGAAGPQEENIFLAADQRRGAGDRLLQTVCGAARQDEIDLAEGSALPLLDDLESEMSIDIAAVDGAVAGLDGSANDGGGLQGHVVKAQVLQGGSAGHTERGGQEAADQGSAHDDVYSIVSNPTTVASC